MSRLVVIGAGITGLSAAWRARSLSKSAEIVVIEREPSLGGKIQTEVKDGFILDAGADGFLSRKPAGVGLCRELGINELLRGQTKKKNRSFVARAHALHPIPEGFSGLVPANLQALEETKLLSEEGRRRAMEEPTIPARRDLGDESVSQFMTRRFGKEAFEALLEPLLVGIYAGDADTLSLQATFPQLRELELARGSVLGGLRSPTQSDLPPFVTFEAGMAKLVGALSRNLVGVRVLTQTEARTITHRHGIWRMQLDHGEEVEADAVIVTAPANHASVLLEETDRSLAGLLASIPFASTAIVHLGFQSNGVAHGLDGYGYVIPRCEGSDFLACTWSSSKWEGRAPKDRVLLRLYSRTQAGDDELVRLARVELRQTMGITSDPVLTCVFRWQEAMPQYTLEHPARVEQIEKRCAGLEGLYLAGASYRGVGIPDCIESGSRAAQAAMERMK